MSSVALGWSSGLNEQAAGCSLSSKLQMDGAAYGLQAFTKVTGEKMADFSAAAVM